MDKIEWSENYSVGVAALDSEHRTLFTMINSLIDEIDGDDRTEDMADLLSDMMRFVCQHFDAEEEYLQSRGYPASVEHTRIHDQFRNLSARFHWQVDGRQLIDDIRTWVIEHITECDREYAVFLAEKSMT